MVAQVLELKAAALEKLRHDQGTEWLGEHFGYRYLPRLLGDFESMPQIERFNWVLLLRAGSETVALHVDALRGNQEIVVKNAGPQYARMVGYSGATVMGDGEIVLILNPVALAARSPSSADDAPLRPLAAPVQTQPTVMVVDDSITMRALFSSALERSSDLVVIGAAANADEAREMIEDMLKDLVKTERRSIDLEKQLAAKHGRKTDLASDVDGERPAGLRRRRAHRSRGRAAARRGR